MIPAKLSCAGTSLLTGIVLHQNYKMVQSLLLIFFFFYTIRRCDLRSTRTIWKGRKAHGPLPGFCAPLRGPGRGNETPQPSPRQRSVPGSQHGAPIHPRTRAGHVACLSLLPGPPRNCLQERCRLGSFPQGRVFAFVFVLFRLIVLKK